MGGIIKKNKIILHNTPITVQEINNCPLTRLAEAESFADYTEWYTSANAGMRCLKISGVTMTTSAIFISL